jgi:hypothetical protein
LERLAKALEIEPSKLLVTELLPKSHNHQERWQGAKNYPSEIGE